MRTTVELPKEKIARLRSLAVRRGLRGYSALINEAVDLYLRQVEDRAGVDEILALAGAWRDEAAEVEERIREFWRRWDERR